LPPLTIRVGYTSRSEWTVTPTDPVGPLLLGARSVAGTARLFWLRVIPFPGMLRVCEGGVGWVFFVFFFVTVCFFLLGFFLLPACVGGCVCV